jgi:hypothetical protein
MLVVSYGIFHRRRRKIMALIPLKARTGIAALAFAAAMAPFAEAGPITIFYGENDLAFRLIVVGGPINADEGHGISDVLMPQKWAPVVGIMELNEVPATGPPDVPLPSRDSLTITASAQHIVGVPGHLGEGPNPLGVSNIVFEVFATAGNSQLVSEFQSISHPPTPDHEDTFRAFLNFTTNVAKTDILM